jgi:ankyrin repeat protein
MQWAKSATTRALLEHGADVHFQDKSHQTAIMFAAQSASAATIKVLLEYGADPSKENLDHETPLLLSASFNTHAMAIATLLEAGARIDHRGTSSWEFRRGS